MHSLLLRHRSSGGRDAGSSTSSRAPPPMVSASATLGRNNAHDENAITTEMMGDGGYDDDLSPAMLEKLHRLREEKRRREMDKDTQRMKEQEYPHVYGGPCTGCYEFNAMIYAVVKMIIYIILLALCVRNVTGDFDLRPCNTFEGNCLFTNATVRCVSTAGSDACNVRCRTDFPLQFDTAGCIVSQINATDITCIPDFNAQCIATDTCPAKPNTEYKTAFKYAAAVFGIFVGLEILYAIAMASTKSLHFSDFERLSCFQKTMVVYSKIWGVLSQIVWIFGLLSAAYLFYIWSKYESSCAKALTNAGTKYAFFSQGFVLTIALLAVHVLTAVVGTWFRARQPLRGNIYRAAGDSSIHFPLGLDCKACRDRARPRWCTGCFKPHMNKENIVGCCCNCTSCLIDCVCCISFECVGLAMEQLWRHKFFIGP